MIGTFLLALLLLGIIAFFASDARVLLIDMEKTEILPLVFMVKWLLWIGTIFWAYKRFAKISRTQKPKQAPIAETNLENHDPKSKSASIIAQAKMRKQGRKQKI